MGHEHFDYRGQKGFFLPFFLFFFIYLINFLFYYFFFFTNCRCQQLSTLPKNLHPSAHPASHRKTVSRRCCRPVAKLENCTFATVTVATNFLDIQNCFPSKQNSISLKPEQKPQRQRFLVKSVFNISEQQPNSFSILSCEVLTPHLTQLSGSVINEVNNCWNCHIKICEMSWEFNSEPSYKRRSWSLSFQKKN